MRRLSYLALCSALAVTACKQDSVQAPATLAPNYTPSHTTRVSGFVYDPEAMNWSFNQDPNGGPPAINLQFGSLLRSLVHNASVSVLDEATLSTVVTAPDPTDPYGAFVVDAPASTGSYLMGATATGGVLEQPQPTFPNAQPVPPMDPPLPPGNYLPTVMLRQVSTNVPYCYVPIVPVASDSGILQAVAKFYTNVLGQPMQVSDLLDPTKFGGVIVWNLIGPLPWNIVFPAYGAGSSATAEGVDPGAIMTLNLGWAAPGDPSLPPEAVALQSDRGYIVADPTMTDYFAGISVTLLPPSSGPTTVTLHSTDYVNDASQGRPYSYLDHTFTVEPGVISYGFQGPDLGPNRTIVNPADGSSFSLGQPDPWRCVVDPDQDI